MKSELKKFSEFLSSSLIEYNSIILSGSLGVSEFKEELDEVLDLSMMFWKRFSQKKT